MPNAALPLLAPHHVDHCGSRLLGEVDTELIVVLDECFFCDDLTTREQRCWVHKRINVLDKLPKRLQPEAKEKLHAIWMAETRADADKAFDLFLATHQAEYAKATECLAKDSCPPLHHYLSSWQCRNVG